jgi:hypothetical protein
MKLLGARPRSLRPLFVCAAVSAALGGTLGSGLARADGVSAQPPPPPPPPSPAPPAAVASPPPREYAYPPGYYAGPPRAPLVITDWPEDEPAPPGYHRSTRVRRGPIIGGSILFGITYTTTVLVAAGLRDSGNTSYGWLYLPGIGPLIDLANSGSATASTFLVLDGLAQSAGLALLIWGLTSPSPVLVRNQIDAPRVMPAPILFAHGGSGFGLVGMF